MSALERLGGLVAQGTERVPPDMFDRLRLHLADTVGALIAAAATAEGRALVRFRASQAETVDQTEGALRDIALNCALARLSEIDDIHLASVTTPGSIVIPAALTLARLPSATPESLVPAMTAGYETMIRLGLAIDGPTILYRGIWPTYIAAPLATAAVAARLLGLDADQCAHALALALSLASPGVGHHAVATTSRWLAVGHAARTGVSAALAARAGFTSDLNLLDGAFPRDVYGIKPDLSALVDRLGEHTLSDVSFKPWCAARQTMAATFGLKQVIHDGVAEISEISEIKVFIPPPQVKMLNHGVIRGNRASHLTSLPYQLAVAAIMPEAAYDVAQSPPAVPDAVRNFMAKIKVEPDESLLEDYPRLWRARVRVSARNETHEREVRHVPGDSALAFDIDQVKEKFRRFVVPVLGTEAAERTLELSLSALDEPKVYKVLMQQLASTVSS